ncbi:hypothetical protein [Streptomyces sp. NPDC049040]|uniref:hypothetical protein n=1 Tax=Streptomyces sp. NPDC049040 TaxID=3365593 RepID=UPI00372192F6
MAELPPGVERIRKIEAGRPRVDWPFVEHVVQFTYGTGEEEVVLANIGANGPLPIPAAGQVVRLHDAYVRVVFVGVSYGATADGAPIVHALARVESAEAPAGSVP